MYMTNCPSCGFKVELNWKVCPSCTNPLVFPSSINQDNVSAADSVIQGDQFSGTKAETIIINQYGNGAGNNVPSNDSSTNSKAIENTPTPIVEDQPLKKCSRCKLELADSLQPINCVEPDCEKSMCSSCYGLWRVPQMSSWQYCQQHTESHRKVYELQCENCYSCDTVIGYGIDHSNCEFDECNNMMCMTCYTKWFVPDPMYTYRADSGPWDYCKNHTQQVIEEANQQLEARINILNDSLNQNIPEMVKKIDLLESEKMKTKGTGWGIVFALIFCILIYPGKLFVMSKISGFLFTLYNIFCFWLMIPIALLFLMVAFNDHEDNKENLKNAEVRLAKTYNFEEFKLKPNQEIDYYVYANRTETLDPTTGQISVIRTRLNRILIDYDSVEEMVIARDRYSDGSEWEDTIELMSFGLRNKIEIVEES